jgi:putative endonuclease
VVSSKTGEEDPVESMEPKKKSTLPLGRSGETIARTYLEKKKFRIVESGFRFHRGEIDLIAWDRETLVFIEVKTRAVNSFGRPEEAVTESKQRQVRKLAEGYLLKRRLVDVACRFDVIAVRIGNDGPPQIEHFRDAF